MKFDLRRAATLAELRAFLAGAAGHDFEPVSRREAYSFIRELLRRFPYDRPEPATEERARRRRAKQRRYGSRVRKPAGF